METKTRIAELNADAKEVYNAGSDRLVELAQKYNVSTSTMRYELAHPSNSPVFKTQGDKREIRGLLYATIKREIAKGA